MDVNVYEYLQRVELGSVIKIKWPLMIRSDQMRISEDAESKQINIFLFDIAHIIALHSLAWLVDLLIA